MADTKISALTAGAPAVATDVLPIQRGAGNNSLLVSDVRDLITGSTVANGATVTTDKPVLALTQTWNAGAVTFNGVTINITNTASATASAILDLQVGGSTRFKVHPAGPTIGNTEIVATNAAGTGVLRLYESSGDYLLRNYASGTARGYLQLSTSGSARLAATNSQVVILDSTSGSGVRITHNSVNVDITNATGTIQFAAAVKTTSTTVASLPAAATAGSGARAFVTDATATTFLSTVAGGGANKVPVVSDGTNWLIG